MTVITHASTDEHLRQILALQGRYHLRATPAEAQAAEGFVYAEHTLPLLRRMAAVSPQAIALSQDQVVGYCLSLPTTMSSEVPALVPMFEQLERFRYRGQPLSARRFFVGGQVCVDREHRGQRLLQRLYEHLRLLLASSHELCVTEISSRNVVSLRAHEKMGFERIASYDGGAETWIVVAWDLAGSPAAPGSDAAIPS
jgi:GNAT superfamily N-acetyltransferase